MKNFIIIILLFHSFIFLYSVNAEPNKKETAEFISKKTNMLRYGIHKCDRNSDHSIVTFSDNYCTLTMTRTYYNRAYVRTSEYGNISCRDNTIAFKEDIVVNLKEVDPDRITKESRSVSLIILEDKKKIKDKRYNCKASKGGDKPETHYKNYIYIETYNPSVNRDKLYKALKHQVKLCGGKGELF